MAPISPDQNDEEGKVLYFALEGLLPPGQRIAVFPTLGTVTHLTAQAELPAILGEVQLAPAELCLLLLPLLEAYPHYCPTEVLLASFTHATTSVSEQMVERARARLHAAEARGTWSQVTQPVRNTLSRVRKMLRPLELTLVAMINTGYLLKRASEKGQQQQGEGEKG